MSKAYEFADERKYREENLAEVIKGGHSLVEESDDIDTIAHVTHMVRHALFEHKQRRIEETADRIVRE